MVLTMAERLFIGLLVVVVVMFTFDRAFPRPKEVVCTQIDAQNRQNRKDVGRPGVNSMPSESAEADL